jgi:hypothetical protein
MDLSLSGQSGGISLLVVAVPLSRSGTGLAHKL